jgi:hypothetical protein
MVRYLTRRRERDEHGVVAILVALLALVIMMFAAYAIDIGMQVNRKHQLNDTLDAAAQAGAFALPGSSVTAKSEALAFAAAHDPTATGTLVPNVDFWCVVASRLSGGSYVVDPLEIPTTCNPGPSPYTVGATYGSSGGRVIACSVALCAIPCVEPSNNNATPPIACNTIRVFQGRDVPFAFAPAGGIMKGSTGNLISVACKGSCGTIAPNPMDVAVVADRTESMGNADITNMVAGIKGMLQQMTPSQQYVSLGTIGRSAPTATGQSGTCDATSKGLTWPSASGSSGQWIPISFSNDYVDASQTLRPSSPLVKGVNCLTQSDRNQGTVLAAPMKAAAKYLLGYTLNNVSSLEGGTPRSPTPKKVLIFETDGQPNERQPTSGDASLTSGDVFSHPMHLGPTGVTTTQSDQAGTPVTSGTTVTTMVTHRKTLTYTYDGGATACQNLIDVAANAKAKGILVIMIGYNMSSKRCFDYDGIVDGYTADRTNYTAGTSTTANPTERKTQVSNGYTYVTNYQTTTTTKHVKASSSRSVLSVMAEAASPTGVAGEVPAIAQSDCSDVAERAAENSDGDYLFCGATGTDMAPIFRTALSQVSKGIKLLKLP